MRTCYESGLKTDPKLTGTVVTRFVLGEDGLVKEAVADKSSTMSDPKVVECVVGELRNVSYPKTASGNITVVYPIVFTP